MTMMNGLMENVENWESDDQVRAYLEKSPFAKRPATVPV